MWYVGMRARVVRARVDGAMWTRVVFLAGSLLLVAATIDLRIPRRRNAATTQADCIDFTKMADRNFITTGWRSKRMMTRSIHPTMPSYPIFPLLNTNEIYARRIDRFLPNAEDIVKEHAKLVQDINGLRQVAFVKPIAAESRDYEDSIFHDTIEVSTTGRPPIKLTTPRPPPRPTRSSSIPVILVGGASQNDLVRSQPMKFSNTISLVGTSVSPVAKHPYPFVKNVPQKPLKICMNPMHLNMFTTTHRPSLLQRLLNSILPRGR